MSKTINISLPKALSEQIRYQVKEGGYASISEYIRVAIRSFLKTSSGFSPGAEEEILRLSQASTKKDLKFDSKKQSVSQFLEQITK